MVINYREMPVGPVLFFLLFVLVCLIGMPTWALIHFGAPHDPFAGKLILAPLMGVLFLITIARTFIFNARVRHDPRALQWDGGNLSLWQNGRGETLPWPQVVRVSVKAGKRPSDLSFLKIATLEPGAGVSRWSFSSGRLKLEGQTLAELANELERARAGNPVAPVRTASAADGDAEFAQRVASARAGVAISTSVYFVTLVGMVVYLSSPRTTLLTPDDPLLWLSAKCTFFSVVGVSLFWYVKTVREKAPGAWLVAASFLPRVLFTAIGSGAMMGLWAYLATNVYVTAKTFGGHTEHGAVLMAAEPAVSFHGRPAIYAHLTDRPGQSVLFTIDPADKKSMDEWYEPGVPENAACVTVPVEWAGHAIRAEANSDTPLPNGSVTGCP